MTRSVPEQILKDLMLRSLDGDDRAYRTLLYVLRDLLLTYYRNRLGNGRDHDVEDLTQEVLMAVHYRRITYNRQRPFTAWFFQIAKYKLIDHLRLTSRKRNDVGLDDELAADFREEAMYAHLDINRLLDRLPGRQRDLLRQVRINGSSVSEVSAQTGTSEGAVRVNLHRGIREIARQLGLSDERKR